MTEIQRDRPAPEETALSPEVPRPERMAAQAARAADFLKSLGHEQRLLILCHLGQEEKTVGELETLLGARQAAVSQQLARLRFEGLVSSRRDGKSIHYALADERARRLISLLYEMFCARA